ncbi:MAG: hypothetical protein MUO60_08295, partial [Clostridiaceae bacterium]|nr:hypothetical protein [Clostridiaceae bacterium]
MRNGWFKFFMFIIIIVLVGAGIYILRDRKNYNMFTEETNDYNKLFKTIKYDNNTVYFSPQLEPALELVHVY